MPSKYVEIVNGSSDPRYPAHRDNALAAGDFVDSSDSFQRKFSKNGVDTTLQERNAAPVVVSAATLTLAAKTHGDRTVTLTSLAGCAVTLPAATGSGSKFTLVLGVDLTSGALSVAVANAADYMRGFAYVKTDDSATTSNTYATANTGTVATETDTISWNRTTTGAGKAGDYIELIDIAANVWAVETENNATGTEATPFSVAV